MRCLPSPPSTPQNSRTPHFNGLSKALLFVPPCFRPSLFFPYCLPSHHSHTLEAHKTGALFPRRLRLMTYITFSTAAAYTSCVCINCGEQKGRSRRTGMAKWKGKVAGGGMLHRLNKRLYRRVWINPLGALSFGGLSSSRLAVPAGNHQSLTMRGHGMLCISAKVI